MDPQQHIARLWQQFAAGQASPEELDELFNLLKTEWGTAESENILREWMEQAPPDGTIDQDKWRRMAKSILSSGEEVLVLPLRKNRFRLGWVAAAVMVAALAGGWIWWTGSRPSTPVAGPALVAKDLGPGSQHALLTLGDGRQIPLDSGATGLISRQGHTRLLNEDGQLTYRQERGDTAILYNTVTTARGNQYQVRLPDGTKVWLNAASTLRFPTTFGRGARTVELTGEAFFEVASDGLHPFLLTAGGNQIQVLGTSFNVMAYEDEAAVKTTLISGAVRVRAGASQELLHPGQQSVCPAGTETLTLSSPDLSEVTAWKDGKISLNNADLAAVMRQIARWYNVDVTWQGSPGTLRLWGIINRNVNLADVLSVLEKNGARFKVEGRRIIVLPAE